MKKVVFLDRDGVINHDSGYVYKIDEFQFIDGVFEACKYFVNLGFEIIVITNQSGIGRGYFTLNDFKKLTSWMKKEFENNGINILNVYFCPHSPNEDCNCRKPQIGMIEQALNEFDIDLSKSWLIGDKESDMQTAINANIPNKILINSKYVKNNELTSNVVNSLLDTITIIK